MKIENENLVQVNWKTSKEMRDALDYIAYVKSTPRNSVNRSDVIRAIIEGNEEYIEALKSNAVKLADAA